MDKVSTDIKKEFDREPVYKKEFLKIKFPIPKVDSNHTLLAVSSSDFALRKDDNYYMKVFLTECKYIEKKVIRHINH